MKKLGSSLDGQTLAQLKEIDHLNAESHKSLVDMRNKGMAMLNLSSQIGVIPNETKYNKAWQKIVNDTGPTVFSHEENQRQSQQIASASAKKEKPLMITADNNVELMIPPNPA